MRCSRCGMEVVSGSFCPVCGEKLSYNGYESVVNSVESFPQKEKIGIGWVILSWFIPLAGLIIFLVKKEKTPRTAKVSGICALISFILNMIITIVAAVGVSMYITNNVIENVQIEDSVSVSENYESQISQDEWNALLDEIGGEDINISEKAADSLAGSEVSDDWMSYEVVVNGNAVTFPCSYQEIADATGAKMTSADEKSYLEPGYYNTMEFLKDDMPVCYVDIMNETEEDILYVDGVACAIYQYLCDVEAGADVVVFPGGLHVGMEMTREELENMFGIPIETNEYAEEGYESYSYVYGEDEDYTYLNCMEIVITDGVIDYLYMDHSEY